jgi:hypothetical protein
MAYLPAANVVVMMPVVAMVPIRSAIVVGADAYADPTRPHMETNCCHSRHSRADRDCRHKRNSKLSHVLPPVLVALLDNGEQHGAVPIVPLRNLSHF